MNDFKVQVGKDLLTNKYNNWYLSAQPSNEDIEQLKKQGFSAIINLRDPREEGYDEKKEHQSAKSHNLTYAQVTFPMDSELTDEYLFKIKELASMAETYGKVLIHCRSSNKAAIWLSACLFKDGLLSKEEAWEFGLSYGIEKDDAKLKLKKFLEEN